MGAEPCVLRGRSSEQARLLVLVLVPGGSALSSASSMPGAGRDFVLQHAPSSSEDCITGASAAVVLAHLSWSTKAHMRRCHFPSRRAGSQSAFNVSSPILQKGICTLRFHHSIRAGDPTRRTIPWTH